MTWARTGGTSAGVYAAVTGLVTGSASAQNVASIENPVGSAVTVYVLVVLADGVASDSAAVIFQYTVARTTAVPTAGTTLTAQKFASSSASPTALVRQAPTATAASGALWVASPGVILPATIALTQPVSATRAPLPLYTYAYQPIVLAAGEGLLVAAGANDTDWRHFASFRWQEV